jgi:hypothetical protein
MKTPTPSCRRAAPRSPRVPRIELDTPLVPWALMEAVCEEAGVWLGHPLPRRWIRELTARANTIYAHNPRFRRKVQGAGNRGRDFLWAFARHWLAGLAYERRPALYAKLPASYCVGHPLPPKPSVPERLLKSAPSGLPLRRRRPAPGYAFAAAAHFPFTW